MFLEEPVPPNNLEALEAVRAKSPVAISSGERLYTRFDYNELFRRRACDYIQPDISHAGGIMEIKKIAAIAEAKGAELTVDGGNTIQLYPIVPKE